MRLLLGVGVGINYHPASFLSYPILNQLEVLLNPGSSIATEVDPIGTTALGTIQLRLLQSTRKRGLPHMTASRARCSYKDMVQDIDRVLHGHLQIVSIA
jgi:hypothetical protein